MRRLAVVATLVVLVGAVACSGSDDDPRPSKGQLSAANAYLHDVARREQYGHALVRLGDGLLFYGGTKDDLDDASSEVEVLSEGVALDDQGNITLAFTSAVPLAEPNGTRVGDDVYLLGTACERNTGYDDVGVPQCTPGTLRLLRIDLRSGSTGEVALPAGLRTTNVTGIGLSADGRLLLVRPGRISVDRGAPSGGRIWLADDDVKTWRQLHPIPANQYCTTGDSILSVVADVPVGELVQQGTAQANVFVRVLDLTSGRWGEPLRPNPLFVRSGLLKVACAAGHLLVTPNQPDAGKDTVTSLLFDSQAKQWSTLALPAAFAYRSAEGGPFDRQLLATEDELEPYALDVTDGATRVLDSVTHDGLPAVAVGQGRFLFVYEAGGKPTHVVGPAGR